MFVPLSSPSSVTLGLGPRQAVLGFSVEREWPVREREREKGGNYEGGRKEGKAQRGREGGKRERERRGDT